LKRSLVFLILLFLCVHLWPLFSSQERWFSPKGFEVNVFYRKFQPGEIIVLSIQDNPAVRSAQVRFLGKKYQLIKNPKASRLLSLIGLDLGIKPGKYPLQIYIQGSDGQWNVLEKLIIISPREFPVKRLWVKEEYVTPPSTVLERIRRESELLRSVYKKFTQTWLGEDSFIMPTEGKVFDNFGERRIYNNKPRSSHAGVDISAPTGTPVWASNSGEVALASDLYFSGKTVIIDHGLGLFSLYCHFSKIKVKRGQVVRKGDIIGEIGATGRVTGPHLHWGVKILGDRVDPFSLLSLNFD
jgi:hypothetical protein